EADGEACAEPSICVDSGDGASAACEGDCAPDGSTQCVGTQSWQQCEAGEWVDQTACPFVCLGDTCGGVCAPNTSTCNENNARVSCGSTGQWGVPVTCTGQTCIEGKCTGSCEHGKVGCHNGNVVVCSQGEWKIERDCEGEGRDLGLTLTCRPVGKPSDPKFVCGECPYGDGETAVNRCHTTVDHGVASELCIYEEGKAVTVWNIEKQDCRACYQGTCDVDLEEVCGKHPLARGCIDVGNYWTCDGGKLNEFKCPSADTKTFCEITQCVPMS